MSSQADSRPANNRSQHANNKNKNKNKQDYKHNNNRENQEAHHSKTNNTGHQNKHQQQSHPRPSTAKKNIDVTDGNCNFINIPIEQYVEGINSFTLSMDALEMCNQLGVKSQNHWTIAVQSALKFLDVLRGVSINKKERDLLIYYDIGLSPVYSSNLRKSIAYIKWVLSASSKLNNINDEFATYVGLLAGVCLYFNEIDVINASTGKNIKNYRNLREQYTSIEF
jgi:hypothetical protein